MTVQEVIILGAGPCGMAAAIALAKVSAQQDKQGFPKLHITLVELRTSLQTIGGTINLTPLAMRYLDYLGVGLRVRKQCINLDHGMDTISLRTGHVIGNIWGSIGGIRVVRHDLVECLLQTLTQDHADIISVQWGKKVTEITEGDDKVTLSFQDMTTLQGDVLLGCDGLHSSARRLVVDPQRREVFTGRVIAMGWVDDAGSPDINPPMKLPNGKPALRDTATILGPNGMLLTSYYEPTRTKIYFAEIMIMDEPAGDVQQGWKIRGNDQDAVKEQIIQTYCSGRVEGLQKLVSRCNNWHLYPTYMLSRKGRWHTKRTLLMGDAAHAMPPQGESTGLAIEDGVLLAHVFERRNTRNVKQLLTDFETLRSSVIDNHYGKAVWAMEHGVRKRSSFMFIVLEWMVWMYLLWRRWTQVTHFAGDVRRLELPP